MKKYKKNSTTKNENLLKIGRKFMELKEKNKLALMPFIMAGDPNLETTSEILIELQEKGADFIELGIPYSDPLADGPIIQLSASRALKSGTTLKKVIKLNKPELWEEISLKRNTLKLKMDILNKIMSFNE